ncbi:Unknown protein sequence [Pseudomonas savastanoi pv. phaseolicola]|nr:Unknown protein sequence [Pseudomonas savastanoi pv. phaseolicola]KPB46980.1 Unknown protein sequence [Pseudomonas savastanoi pv. phaseolicola]KPB47917.1 Unknown protein sequence [Pseudomonas savastanoi pv. phaseolicola]KPB74675.1 Unknown protein sequence [Pseudomonas amygdali pv. mellea]
MVSGLQEVVMVMALTFSLQQLINGFLVAQRASLFQVAIKM